MVKVLHANGLFVLGGRSVVKGRGVEAHPPNKAKKSPVRESWDRPRVLLGRGPSVRIECMKGARQTTLCDQTAVSGIGVHSGLPATLTIHPADAHTGIVFVRSRGDGHYGREIHANVRAVTSTDFATVLGDAALPRLEALAHALH